MNDTSNCLNCQPFSYRICNVILGLWTCCTIALWVANLSNLLPLYGFSHYQEYAPLLILAIVTVFVLLFVWLMTICHKYTQDKIAFIIFSVSLLLRLAFLPCTQYIPSNDFAHYFAAGRDFALNGFQSEFHLEEIYGIPSFAGMAVLNGIIARIFSPTLLGFQVSNSAITAGICVLIYKLGVRVNEKGAIAGACLYCVYPSSILSSQITSNQHGATLFILMGIYAYDKALHTEKEPKNRILLAVLSAILLLIGNYFHPSVIITVCAILMYTIIECIGDMIYSIKTHKKALIRYAITPLLALCITFSIFNSVTMHGMQMVGFLSTEPQKIHILHKVVLGLNPDTKGTYSEKDIVTIASTPNEHQLEICLNMIRERLNNPALISMLVEKVKYYLFDSDNLFYLYGEGAVESINTNLTELEAAFSNEEISEIEYKINRDNLLNHLNSMTSWVSASVAVADSNFVFVVWGFAIIGLIWMIKRKKYDIIYLLAFIPMGWMMFIIITEVQSRYRYQSMPIVTLMAGIGIQLICEAIFQAVCRIKKQRINDNRQFTK